MQKSKQSQLSVDKDQQKPLNHSLTIIQCLFVGPVGSLLDVLKMWVLLAQSRVKYCHLHTRTFGRLRTPLVLKSRWKQRWVTRRPVGGHGTDLCVPSAREHLPGGSGPHGEGWPAADACWSGGLWRARTRSPATNWSVGTAGTTATTAISVSRGWRCRERKVQGLR